MHCLLQPPAGAALVLIAVAAVCGAAVLRRAWPLWALAGLIWTGTAIDARLEDRLPAALEGKDVELTGWVDGFPRRTGGQMSFSFRVAGAARTGGLPSRVRLTWYEPDGAVTPGSAWRLTARLKAPRGSVNPGGLDFERWLFVEGYGATGYVRSASIWADAPITPARRWLGFRYALAERIAAAISDPDDAALVTALVIGERGEFTDEHWRHLRRTGTSHLIAISGLHVGLVSALVFMLTRRLWLRLPPVIAMRDLEAAAAASLVSAVAYASLAGFTLPTQRALIMLSIALLSLVARRRVAMPTGMTLALLFVLIWDPLALVSATFWLSFSAVGLLWQLGEVRALTRSRGGGLRQAAERLCRVQWGLTLGLLPCVILFFSELSLISPLVNLLAVPLFSFGLIPLSLAAAAVTSISSLGQILLVSAGVFAHWTWELLALAASGSWSAIGLRPLEIGWMVLAVAGAVVALPVHPLPGRCLGWVAIAAVLLSDTRRPPPQGLDMTVLDVGHGLAVVVRTQSYALLYDAGARYRSGFDTGSQIVVPALRALGIESLDTVIVSHADNDHAGGLAAVASQFPDARIIAGADVDWPGSLPCSQGQRWQRDGVTFEILHPSGSGHLRGNDGSCVLRIRAASGAALLTGDIEVAGERALVSAVEDLAADVVVVPHHGSSTSSTAALIQATRPRYAVVSAAHNNRWGFPRPEVGRRWESAGAEVLVTAASGAVTVEFGRSGLTVREARARSPRYWRAPSG